MNVKELKAILEKYPDDMLVLQYAREHYCEVRQRIIDFDDVYEPSIEKASRLASSYVSASNTESAQEYERLENVLVLEF